MARLDIPDETHARLNDVARASGRNADSLAAEALEAFVEGEGTPLPRDWADYMRYRFEEGRKAMARGEYTGASPSELMARIRARVEAKPR